MEATPQEPPSRKGFSVHLAHVDSLPLSSPRTPIAIHRRLAADDSFGVHRLVDDPEEADVVLFTECHLLTDWRLRAIREHPLRRRFPERSYCFNERDRPWVALPGLYASPPASTVDRRFQVPWAYPGLGEVGIALVEASHEAPEPDLLFSFVGSPGPRCRDEIFCIRHPRALIERVEQFSFFDPTSPSFEERRAHYRSTTLRSKFVLCPRGNGTSSIRLYETLGSGRVPVILADEWLEPEGPDWNAFSVRLPESEANRVATHIERLEDRWPDLSAAARRAYEEWFSQRVAFHRSLEALRPLVERDTARAFPWNGVKSRQFFMVALDSTLGTARHGAVKVRDRIRTLTATRRR